MDVPQPVAPPEATPASDIDPLELRKAFGAFPTGVTALAALVDGAAVGMAASSFTSVSIEPRLVSVCLALESSTWPTLRGAPAVGVSVLSRDDAALSRQLAASGSDRFSGVDCVVSPGGAIRITGASVYFECRLYGELPAGDHVIALLEIMSLRHDAEIEPLVFHRSRYRALADV